jgi:hypothetical protein
MKKISSLPAQVREGRRDGFAGAETIDLTPAFKARQSDESGFWGLVDAVLCMRLASIAAAVNV